MSCWIVDILLLDIFHSNIPALVLPLRFKTHRQLLNSWSELLQTTTAGGQATETAHTHSEQEFGHI